jgi:hypothetical protein
VTFSNRISTQPASHRFPLFFDDSTVADATLAGNAV